MIFKKSTFPPLNIKNSRVNLDFIGVSILKMQYFIMAIKAAALFTLYFLLPMSCDDSTAYCMIV